MNMTPSFDSYPSEFGWPLPKRKQHFDEIKNGAGHHFRIDFMNQTLILPVLRVPINLPRYRLLNGRTESAQQEWLVKHPDKPVDFFQQDPESEEVQRVQNELLGKLVSGANLMAYFRKPGSKQNDPIILDYNGFVINGNRRLCAWRTLFKEDPQQYCHYSHIDIVVLPPSDDMAIDKLEGELQVEPDIRDDYTWDSLANMMKVRQNLHGLNTKALADFYKKKESDVIELLDMLEYASDYLKTRGKSRLWSEVSDKEYAFRQMVKKREQFSKAGEKRLAEEFAFILIDDPDGGRLYESIPEAYKYFNAIRGQMIEAFPVPTVEPDQSLDILGGDNIVQIDTLLANEIGKCEETRKRAASIIRDQIEMAKLLDKEKKSIDFLLHQLQRANGLVQSAIASGLRPESRRNGVEHQIAEIERGLLSIRHWLNSNA